MDAVFLDTNCIRNTGVNSFFGKVDSYQNIASLADVYVPHIVMEEIKVQKLRKLTDQLNNYKNNYFAKLTGFNIDELNEHVSTKINELYAQAKDEIEHTEIYLNKSLEHMDLLKGLALQNKAPFEVKDDKGFKDAYIYLTILQFLEENSGTDVFLITNDGRLKEAFSEHEHVTVISEPKDYFMHRSSYFTEEYFISTIGTYFNDATITSEHISEITLNDDEQWQMFVMVGNEETAFWEMQEQGKVQMGLMDAEDVNPHAYRTRHQVIVDFASKEIIEHEQV